MTDSDLYLYEILLPRHHFNDGLAPSSHPFTWLAANKLVYDWSSKVDPTRVWFGFKSGVDPDMVMLFKLTWGGV